MIASTPMSSSRCIVGSSSIVHTWTGSCDRCAARTKRSVTIGTPCRRTGTCRQSAPWRRMRPVVVAARTARAVASGPIDVHARPRPSAARARSGRRRTRRCRPGPRRRAGRSGRPAGRRSDPSSGRCSRIRPATAQGSPRAVARLLHGRGRGTCPLVRRSDSPRPPTRSRRWSAPRFHRAGPSSHQGGDHGTRPQPVAADMRVGLQVPAAGLHSRLERWKRVFRRALGRAAVGDHERRRRGDERMGAPVSTARIHARGLAHRPVPLGGDFPQSWSNAVQT